MEGLIVNPVDDGFFRIEAPENLLGLKLLIVVIGP
jgi:hypothetical protein